MLSFAAFRPCGGAPAWFGQNHVLWTRRFGQKERLKIAIIVFPARFTSWPKTCTLNRPSWTKTLMHMCALVHLDVCPFALDRTVYFRQRCSDKSHRWSKQCTLDSVIWTKSPSVDNFCPCRTSGTRRRISIRPGGISGRRRCRSIRPTAYIRGKKTV